MADDFMRAAIEEAMLGLSEGGIPIGSVLVYDGMILGRGHNRRVQRGSVVLHGEMDALENAGRQVASVYQASTLYTTLSPCSMCTGAVLLHGIPRVVVGENITLQGDEALLRSRGVNVEVIQDPTCVRLMTDFVAAHPTLWNEDISASSDGRPVRRYLTSMKTKVSSKGQIVIPAEIRVRDGIRPGEEFDIERLESGEYLLQRRAARVNEGVVDWLLGCPEKEFFVAIESESTDDL